MKKANIVSVVIKLSAIKGKMDVEYINADKMPFSWPQKCLPIKKINREVKKNAILLGNLAANSL
jgi:hypothetical protein